MDEATIALTVMSALVLLVFAGFLVWGLRSGQFRNIEEAKYHIFEDHDVGGEKSQDTTNDGGERRE